MKDYIKKQLRKREEDLKYDFMPPVLEIIEKPAARRGTVIMYTVIALFAAAIIWECFSKLDIVVTAAGSVTGIDNDRYTFTAYVCDEEIARFDRGTPVKVLISAYSGTKYERIEGRIRHISSVPESMGGKGTVYAVNVDFKTAPETIRQGMEGRIDIITGKRSVMEYFLEPFRKGIKESLKEE